MFHHTSNSAGSVNQHQSDYDCSEISLAVFCMIKIRALFRFKKLIRIMQIKFFPRNELVLTIAWEAIVAHLFAVPTRLGVGQEGCCFSLGDLNIYIKSTMILGLIVPT